MNSEGKKTRQSIPAPKGAGILTLVALLIMLAAGTILPARQAFAVDEEMPKLGIQPVDSDSIFFSEEINPGKTKTLKVELSNVGKNDVQILTYAADVYSLVNGGLGVKLADEGTSGTTAWLDYPTQTIDLPHSAGQVVEFTISVPKETTPGEYVTSLVIQNAKPIEGSGGVSMNQILRQAIAVAINVPGDEAPALEIGTIAYHDNPIIDSLLIEVRNTGNIHLKPAGTVKVVDASGASVLEVNVGMDSVYAGMSTMLEIGLTEPLASGDYSVSVDLKDEKRGGEAAVRDLTMNVVDTAQVSTLPRINTTEVVPVRPSDDASVQFANIVVSIDNPQQIANGQVVLHVERDGELVEDYPLSFAGPIETGQSDFQQRYLPLTGWQAGTYTFTVRIEAVDATSGEVTVLVESDEPVSLEIAE